MEFATKIIGSKIWGFYEKNEVKGLENDLFEIHVMVLEKFKTFAVLL